jgi:hypothetical protein
MNNDIKVTGIVDHEDGSATVTLDLSPETYHKIFEYGFLKLITKGMDNAFAQHPPSPDERHGAITLLLYTTRIH